MEILGELLHCMNVGAHGVRRIVTTLKFIQHQLAKMGHRNLLVTHKLHLHHAKEHPRCSVRRVSGFVQTSLWEAPNSVSKGADKVNSLWPNLRLVIALHSPDAVLETGLRRRLPEKSRHRAAFAAEQSVLRSPVCLGIIAKYGHCSRISA